MGKRCCLTHKAHHSIMVDNIMVLIVMILIIIIQTFMLGSNGPKVIMIGQKNRPQGSDAFGNGRQGRKLNRCKVIKSCDNIIEGRAGDTVFAKVILKNNTHWPYKTGV